MRTKPIPDGRVATLRLVAVTIVALVVPVFGTNGVVAQVREDDSETRRPLSARDLRAILVNQPNFDAQIAIWNDDEVGPRIDVGRILRHEMTYRLEPSASTFGHRASSTDSLTPADVVWLFSSAAANATPSLVTICPADRTYSVDSDQLPRVLILAPYAMFVHGSLTATDATFTDEGMSDVAGMPCQILKVTTKDSVTTLWSAVRFNGLIIKGVGRAACCETFNFSGLTFEFSQVRLGSDPALFRTPAGYKPVDTLETDIAGRNTVPGDVLGLASTADVPTEYFYNKPPACAGVVVSGKRVVRGDRVTFGATYIDPDNDVITYSWFLDGAKPQSLTTTEGGKLVLDTTALLPGEHRLTVIGSDGFNAAVECSATFEVVSK